MFRIIQILPFIVFSPSNYRNISLSFTKSVYHCAATTFGEHCVNCHRYPNNFFLHIHSIHTALHAFFQQIHLELILLFLLLNSCIQKRRRKSSMNKAHAWDWVSERYEMIWKRLEYIHRKRILRVAGKAQHQRTPRIIILFFTSQASESLTSAWNAHSL